MRELLALQKELSDTQIKLDLGEYIEVTKKLQEVQAGLDRMAKKV